jgi:hypothetical protein
LRFVKRIKFLENENSCFKAHIESLQISLSQKDIFREKLMDLHSNFDILEKSKKESENREKTLRDKFAHIEGERVNLLEIIENLKKESRKFEESNLLLECEMLKMKNDLQDSSSSNNGSSTCCSNTSIAKAKTIVCFRGSILSKDFRKDHTLGNIPRVYTCLHCGRKGHLRSFCFDLKRSPRKSLSSITLVSKPHHFKYKSIWVRKSFLNALDTRFVDSHLLSHETSLAKFKG